MMRGRPKKTWNNESAKNLRSRNSVDKVPRKKPKIKENGQILYMWHKNYIVRFTPRYKMFLIRCNLSMWFVGITFILTISKMVFLYDVLSPVKPVARLEISIQQTFYKWLKWILIPPTIGQIFINGRSKNYINIFE